MAERFLVLHKSGAILRTNAVTDSDLGAVQIGMSRVVDLSDLTVMTFEPENDEAVWNELPVRSFDDEAEEEDEEETFLWSHIDGARRIVQEPRDLLYEAKKRHKTKRRKPIEDE